MNPHKLSKLFEPKTIAVIGASERAGSVGRAVWQRLHAAGNAAYTGRAFAVNPKHKKIFGTKSVASIKNIAERIDLAVITAPRTAWVDIIKACGENGCNFALILGVDFERTVEGAASGAGLLAAARVAKVRIVGPGARGVLRTRIGLDASVLGGADALPAAGTLAVLSQSGAWLSILRDFTAGTSIGFSSMLSLGGAIDLDFGEMLDYFALDPHTRDVILYMEEIKRAQAFMSGVRQLARIKPVIILKANRAGTSIAKDGTHAAAMGSHDRIFDAAIARAGAVRVQTAMQIVSTARLLSGRNHQVKSNVVVLGNGRGLGVVAVDVIRAKKITMLSLSEATKKFLQSRMPEYVECINPIDLAGDATAKRYRQALDVLLADKEVDVIMLLYAPQSALDADALADEIIAAAANTSKAILVVLGGAASVYAARAKLDAAKIAQFLTAENAIDALGYLHVFSKNQSLLRQVPEQSVDGFAPNMAAAQAMFEAVWADRRQLLYGYEASRLLEIFGIKMAETRVALSPDQAVAVAEHLGYPVVLKVISPDVSNKTDVGGVLLDLRDAQTVHEAATKVFADVGAAMPEARVLGLMVQPYVRRRAQRELYLGLVNDPTFGPVICFGAGGIGVERIDDIAFELPPLNDVLIHHLIERTRVSSILDAYGNVPAIDRAALVTMMLRFSQLVCVCPEIQSIDLNPIIVFERGAIAVDARIVLKDRAEVRAARGQGKYSHLAVYPYPRELEEHVVLKNGAKVFLRPIQPEDAQRERDFVAELSPETLYFRFMMPVRELPIGIIERFTQIDYGRELALVGIEDESSVQKIIGVARITPTADEECCEFAIVVSESMRGTGLAGVLMKRLFSAAYERGYREMYGSVLRENKQMQDFCKHLGFKLEASPDDPNERIARKLLTD